MDSDNDNGVNLPTQSEAEEVIENIQGDVNKPGKLIHVNDDDIDNDYIPDYADGINWDGVNGSDDDSVAEEFFTPLVLSLSEHINLSSAKITISYSSASPETISRNGVSPEYEYSPGSGTMRIWTIDGNQARTANSVSASTPGHFVPSGTFDPIQLGFSDIVRKKTFYIEGINPSIDVAASQISVMVDLDGDGPREDCLYDAVRVTIIKVDLDAVDNSNECTEEVPGTPLLLNDDWDGTNTYGSNPPSGHFEKEPVWDYLYTEGQISAEDDLMQVKVKVSPSSLAGNVILKVSSGLFNIGLWPRSTKGSTGEMLSIGSSGKTYAISALPDENLYVEGLATGRSVMTLEYTFGSTSFTDKLNIDIVSLEEAQGGMRKIIYDYGDAGDPLLFQVKPSTLSAQYTCLWDLDGDGTRNNGVFESSESKLTTVKYSSAANGAGNVQLPQTSANRRKVYNCSVKLKGGELKGGLVINRDVRVALATHQGINPASDPNLRIVEVNGLATPPSGYSDTELPNTTSTKFSQAWFEDSPLDLCYDVNQSVNSYRLQYSPRLSSYGITAFTGVGSGKKVYLSTVCALSYSEGYKLQDLEGVALHECRHAEQLVLCASGGNVFRLLDEYYTVQMEQAVFFIYYLEADAYLTSVNSNSDWLTLQEKLYAFWLYYQDRVWTLAPIISDSTTKEAAKYLLQSIYAQIPFVELKKNGYQYSIKAPK